MQTQHESLWYGKFLHWTFICLESCCNFGASTIQTTHITIALIAVEAQPKPQMTPRVRKAFCGIGSQIEVKRGIIKPKQKESTNGAPNQYPMSSIK
mmetsp:Transcript_29604/g.50419  ORF Transcript_29604/g.50419 Transcript_29604/m.50419 type:complete len:96 (+) Transcript_29604:364-651(+)